MADDNFDNWEDDDGTGGGDYVDDGAGGDGGYDDEPEADLEDGGDGGADDGGGGEALYDEQGNLIYAGEDDGGDGAAADDGGEEQHDNGEGAEFDDGGGGDQSYDQDDGGDGAEMGEDDGSGYPAVIEEGDEDAAAAEEEAEEESGVDPVQEARMAALDAARQKALMNIRSMSGAFKPAVPAAAPSAFSIGGAAAAAAPQQSYSAFAAPQRGASAFLAPSASFSPPASAASAAAAAASAKEKPKTAREKKKELKEQKLAAKLQQQQAEAASNSMSGGGRSNSRSIVPIASAFGSSAAVSKEQAKLDRAARFASTNAAAALAAPSAPASAFGSRSPSFSPSPSPEFGSPPAFIGGRGGAGGGGRSTASLMAAAMGGPSDDLNGGGGGGEEDLFGRQAEHYTPIVGQCLQMCPTEEQQARQESRDLSYFEIIPGTGSKDHGDVPLVNPSAAVKKYKRAAAAQTLHAKDVRPPHILQQTMAYLISKIMDRQDSPDPPPLPPFLVVYRFISDRMRALRQDYACQSLKDSGAVAAYEIMVRFHILTMFELGEINNLEKFDPTPNMEKLSQTLTSLRHMFFDNYAGVNQGRTPFPTPNEAEMHSYRLLVDLDRRFGTLYEELDKFHPGIKASPIIQFCVQIYNAFRENNWVRFFELARKAPYLHAVLLQGYFNKVRSRALEVMSSGPYKSYPFDAFQSLLAFESPRHAVDFLNYHGIELDPIGSPGVIQFKTRGHRGGFQAPLPGATPLPSRNSWRIVGPKRPKLVSQAVQAAIGRGEGLGLEAFIPGGALRTAPAAATGTANKLARAVKQQQHAVDASMDGGGFAAAMGSASSASAFGSQQQSSFNALSRAGASSSNLQSAFGGSSGGSAFAPSSAMSNAFALPAAGALDSSKPGAIKLNRAATGAATAALASSAASIAAAAAAAAASNAAAGTSASGSSSLNAKAAPFVPKSTASVSLPASSSSSAFNSGTAPAFGIGAFAPSSVSATNVGFPSSSSAVFGGTSSSVSFGSFGAETGKSAPPPLDVKAVSTVPTPPLSARGAAPPALQVPSFGSTTAAGGVALPSPRAPLEPGQTEHIAGFQLTALPPAQPSTPRATFPPTTAAPFASQAPSAAAATAGLSRSNAVASSSLSMPPPHPRPPLASSTRSATAAGFSADNRADSSIMVDVPRHTPSVIVSYKRQMPVAPPKSPTPEEAEERFLTALRTYRTSLLRKGLRSWHASSLARLAVRAANDRAQRSLEKRAEVFVQTKFFLRWHEVMREHQEAQIRFNQAQENLHAPIQLISPLRKLNVAKAGTPQQQLLLTSGGSTPARPTAFVRAAASSPAPSPSSLASGVVSSGLLSPYGKLERLGIHVAVMPSLAVEDQAEEGADEELLATKEDEAAEAEQEEEDGPTSGQLDFDAAADDDEGQDQAEADAAEDEDDGPDAAAIDDANDADYVPPAEGEEDEEADEEDAEGAEEEEAEALDGSAEAGEEAEADADGGEEAEAGEGDEEAEAEAETDDADADTGLAPMDMSDDPLAASAHAAHAQRLIHGSPARVGRSAGFMRTPLTPLSASALKSPPTTFVPRVSLLFTSPYSPSRSPAGAAAGAGSSASASGSHKRSRQALEVDAFLDSLMSPGSRGLPAAPAPTPATAARSSRAQNQPAATFDSSHVPLLYDDDSASEGAGLDGERSYGSVVPSSATRAKLFHTPSSHASRAVFSPPSQLNGFVASSSSPQHLNSTFAVGAALDAAASASASPAAYLRPRLSFGNGSSNARFHSSSSHAASASAAAHAPSASSAPVARAGDLLQRVAAEIQQSSKLDQLMQQLEYRYAAQI